MDKLSKVESGRLGGRSRSLAKRQSSRSNLQAARIKRWPGREKSKEYVEQARRDGGDKAATCIQEACNNLRAADKADRHGDLEECSIQESLAQANMAAALLNAAMYQSFKGGENAKAPVNHEGMAVSTCVSTEARGETSSPESSPCGNAGP